MRYEKLLLYLMLVNAIINGGWFVQQELAKKLFGEFSAWFWVYTLPIAYLIAYYMGELAAKYKGPIYYYVKVAFGNLFGFISAWIFLLIAIITTSYLLYVVSQLIPFGHFLSPLIFLLFAYLVTKGVKVGIRFSAIFGVIALITAILTIVLNLKPIEIPPIPPIFYLLSGVFFVFEAFMGWETVANLSGKVSERSIKFALKAATLTAGVLYIIMAFLHISSKTFVKPTFLASFLVLGSILDWTISTPNFISHLAKQGYLHKIFKKENSNGVPIYSLMLFVILVLAFYFSGSLLTILELLIPSAYFLYSLILLSAFYKLKDKVALVGAIILMILFWYNLLINHSLQFFLMFFFFYILLGLAIYFVFSLHRKKVVKLVHNLLAPIIAITAKYWKPLDIVDYIPEDAKKILEIGCGTGIITVELAKRGYFVYATEISEAELEIAKHRAKKVGVEDKIKFILEKKEGIGIKDKVDVAIGIGVLGYITNVEKFLKELREKLNEKGRIIFVDYDLPFFRAPKWLREKHKAKKIFRKAGFDVEIYVKKKPLWREIWIIGEKL